MNFLISYFIVQFTMTFLLDINLPSNIISLSLTNLVAVHLQYCMKSNTTVIYSVMSQLL